jgi:ADP-ribosylglycohydrolase
VGEPSQSDSSSGFWQWTDDTEMACSIAAILVDHGIIDQDALAASFVEHFDFYRGYGPGTITLLNEVGRGTPWQEVVNASFSGNGSFGNGAAMRVPPLGAFFSDDLDAVVEQAERSAVVTHSHAEGVAGAIAVAVAAALATRARRSRSTIEPRVFIDEVLGRTPEGRVRRGLWRARGLSRHRQIQIAVRELGNGSAVTAADTVPFAVWASATRIGDYKEAIWACVQAGGDVDTTAAIVGGIVASFAGPDALPADWSERVEDLPDWSPAALR